MMPLSSHEQRILETIEQQCRDNDPVFVAKFENAVLDGKKRTWRRLFRRNH